MQNGALKDWLDSSFLAGENQAYIEDIYEDYLNDPSSVDGSWREIFDSLPKADITEQPHSQTRDYFRRLAKDSTRYHTSVSDPAMDSKQVKVLQLINAFRFRGHQNANLDPLGLWKQEPVPDLDPAFHNLTK
ncbi:2-oxoglutarate dehydrogenase E1 component, partial [Salmonella enterica subsp. enterica serovar Bareilly]|nr:2-oxoglutarate dehydrogenase E1 component [Salmonella enterica subsp. enterica serovar Bareilly]